MSKFFDEEYPKGRILLSGEVTGWTSTGGSLQGGPPEVEDTRWNSSRGGYRVDLEQGRLKGGPPSGEVYRVDLQKWRIQVGTRAGEATGWTSSRGG